MWFESFLIGRHIVYKYKRQKFLPAVNYTGVPKGSVLGPQLLLLCINNLRKAIQHSSVQNFTDDTNLLFTSKSLKKVSKYINHDLKHLCQWLQNNKISLNASKTEIFILKTKN